MWSQTVGELYVTVACSCLVAEVRHPFFCVCVLLITRILCLTQQLNLRINVSKIKLLSSVFTCMCVAFIESGKQLKIRLS